MLILMTCIVIVGILGGGYYVSVSAVTGIVLTGVLFYRMYVKKRITAAWDLNMAAFAVLVFGYLLSCLWAVDSGMALMGVVKFLPLLLFYVLVSGLTDEREKMIASLPMLGCLMTAFSFVMMQFEVFEQWVSVAGRLSGFFQYPNTYALFMLICLILVMWRFDYKKIDWLDIVYGVAAVFGIIMSGSRTVFVLTAVAVIWVFAAKSSGKKVIISVFAAGAGVAVILAVAAGSAGILERFTNISFGASTFLGRILYVQDALPLILKHPFGLGYYGYYFIQQSVQTGVYTVVNAHNELIQILLDAGVIPAVFMGAAVLRSVFTKRTQSRNRIVLSIMILHSLFDYDFQFLAMGFVLILFLDMRNIKTQKVPVLTGTVVGLTGAAAAALSIMCGVSDVCYTSGNYKAAEKVYSGNTMAQLALLTKADKAEEMKAIAEKVIVDNQSVSLPYSALAQAAFADGDVEQFTEYKLKAIELAPYQYEEYENYLEVLVYCNDLYHQMGDKDGVRFCVEKAEEIPKMLEQVKENTSALGWKIVDRPQVTLSHENLEIIEDMRRRMDE